MKAMKVWIILFVAALATAVTLAVVIVVRESGYSRALHEAQVENCEDNGNPLRKAVQQVYREEIKQSENKDLLHEFFPQISPKKLDEVIEESIDKKRLIIRRIAPIDCQKAYDK